MRLIHQKRQIDSKKRHHPEEADFGVENAETDIRASGDDESVEFIEQKRI